MKPMNENDKKERPTPNKKMHIEVSSCLKPGRKTLFHSLFLLRNNNRRKI